MLKDEQKKECKHQWDKETGTRTKSKPWIGLKSRWERKCKICGKIEVFSDGRNGFTGWFSR
jgi:hypothetical protein